MSKVMKAIANGYVDWKNSKECTNKNQVSKNSNAKKHDKNITIKKEAKKK